MVPNHLRPWQIAPLTPAQDGLIAALCPGLAQSVVAKASGRIDTTPFEPETLAAFQPGLRERRCALFFRLAALRLAGWPVPRYEGLQSPAAARQNPLRRNLNNFAGMLRRAWRV